VETFIAGAGIFGEKLGPLMNQLSPNMNYDDNRLENLLSSLPLGGQYAVEFLHQSWIEGKVSEILGKYNIMIGIFDIPSLSHLFIAINDIVHIRVLGSTGLHTNCYSDEEEAGGVKRLAGLVTNWETINGYSSNNTEGFAVGHTITLRDYLRNAS
jgi:uncharacterized protein YecE (DUF72 family)